MFDPPFQRLLREASSKRKPQSGFSLIEVLLIITMLSLTILPFTLLMTQTAGNARGSYIASSRSILLNSLMDEATVDRNYYVPKYSSATLNTAVSESGQVLPYRRLVDTTNAGASDTFKKTVYFYLYNNASDAANASRYKTKMIFKRDTMRVRFNAYGWVDASGQWWQEYNAYDASNLVPGYTVAPQDWGTANSIVNVLSTTDMEFYKSGVFSWAGLINYNAVVPNGLYTVKLYFVENETVGRLMDIKIEGNLMNPGDPYSAYSKCGGRSFCGNIQMFDVMVTDGVLNIQLTVNSSSAAGEPFISGIMIKKRT